MLRTTLKLLALGTLVLGCSGESLSDAAPSRAGSAGAAQGGVPASAGASGKPSTSGAGGASGAPGAGGMVAMGGMQEPPATLGKLEPPDGSTLLVIGQDTGSIEEYVNDVGPMPAGVMLYANIKDLSGLAFSADFGAGQNDLAHWKSTPKDVAIQIGLNLVDSLGAIGNGNLDANIDKMAELLRDCGHPVFLRIGYEFDSDWAGYEPNAFKKAFQRIASRMRDKSVENVAFVWHSWGFQHSFGQSSITPWYPGDEYVDWVGVSLFPGWDAASIQASAGARREIGSFAKEHGKPLMIAEAGPRQDFQPSRGADAWSGWYQGIFDFIIENDVKLFSYINANWEAQPMWAGKGWGDSRVQTNAQVLERWRTEISKPRFVHGAP